MKKAQEYNSFLKHNNYSYYHKINSSIIYQKAKITHYKVAKQKKNNLLNTIAHIKVKFTK